MNWDDLRIARAVYETGSFAAAASLLRINETTVARRLARLQGSLDFVLFEAIDGERRPTAQCEQLMALVSGMAANAERIGKIGDQATDLVGRRRIATTDSIASEILAPQVGSLLEAHPNLGIDFLASTENVNFSRWAADIAVRFGKPEKGDFLISKLADISLSFVGPVETNNCGSPIVCAYPQDLEAAPEAKYLKEIGLYANSHVTTKNLLVMKNAIRSGGCCGVMPTFMCRDLAEHEAFEVSRLAERRAVWLLVQSHLKNDAVTRAIIDWIRSSFRLVD